jgi:cytoskeletal protein CcmA (bactofilin family)
MWNKDSQTEVPGTSPSKELKTPAAPVNAAPGIRPSAPTARTLACLGATIVVKGEIHSDEDLQIDGKVEGNISLQGHRLTVGRTAQLNSEITAREVIVYGNAAGNLRARDRVEIKKDGQVIGDITTTRISIEEGAYFKGHIEIERAHSPIQENKENETIPVGSSAY